MKALVPTACCRLALSLCAPSLGSRQRLPQIEARYTAILSRAWSHWLKVALSVFLYCVSVSAQTVQFLPEVDTYLTLSPMFRVYNQTKDDRDGGDSTQITSGPSLQLYLKPLLKLKKITAFDLDDSKPRPLVLEAGYRYITAPNEPFESRFTTAVTFRFPMTFGFLISDRNRADLDWKSGTSFNWRYRNKFTLERTFSIHSYHPIPYVAFEPYYESQYAKWSTTTEYVGCLLPVGKHVQFNPYYEHENDTGSTKGNKQEQYVGLAVHFFFSVSAPRNAKQP
jgi:hypothetical protein